MPRNPLKTRCQIPNCRNWAMRGHTRCRPHRDPELGPRGGGAPPGNLNALRTGQHAHPLSSQDLDHVAAAILGAPDQLPHHLDLTLQSLHLRCRDPQGPLGPVKTLLALQSLLPDLLSRVASGLFAARLHALLDQVPPSRRDEFERAIRRQALLFDPVQRLDLLHQFQSRLQAAATALPDLGAAPYGGDSP